MVTPESDASVVVEGLKQDVRSVKRVEKHDNRLLVVASERGTQIYPDAILEYLALAGWAVERIRFTSDGDPVAEFVRRSEFDELMKRSQEKFDTIDFESLMK